MKCLLIHVWNEVAKSYRGKFSNLFSYPSLTIATVYSLIPKGVFEKIDVIDENSQKVNYDKEFYDVVMLSFETSSAYTAFKHCDEFKKRGSYIVCGGYFPSAMPDAVLEHCDTVIKGPGEISIPQFVNDYAAGNPQRLYSNYDVKPSDFVVPARDKVTMKKKLNVASIVANPGCFNACKYCSMRTMWNSIPRPVEEVVEELKSLNKKLVVFFDPNFFGNRDYVMELMKAMTPLKLLWAANATADFGYDDELMETAYKSGCRGILLGLESFNISSLSNAAKRFSKADKYKEIIANIHKHNIAVNGCFVLGFDNDTKEELKLYPKKVDELGLDLCRFAILTPYPGTKQYEEYDKAGRITTKEWQLYNQFNVVFEPKNMTPVELEEIYREVWKESFTWKRVWKRYRRSPLSKHIYGLVLLGANIGFKYNGMESKRK